MDLWDFRLAKLLRRLLLQLLEIGRDDRLLNLARDVFYLKVNSKTGSPLNFRLAEVTKAKLFAEFNYNFKCPEDISSQKLKVKEDFFSFTKRRFQAVFMLSLRLLTSLT